MDLKNISDGDLLAELHRRREEKAKEEIARRASIHTFVCFHIDNFLLFAPTHDRTSCNDEEHCNASEGCTRCALLDIKEQGTDSPRMEITLEIRPYERDPYGGKNE